MEIQSTSLVCVCFFKLSHLFSSNDHNLTQIKSKKTQINSTQNLVTSQVVQWLIKDFFLEYRRTIVEAWNQIVCHLTQCPNNVEIRNYMLNNCANQVKRCSYKHQRRVSVVVFFSFGQRILFIRKVKWLKPSDFRAWAPLNRCRDLCSFLKILSTPYRISVGYRTIIATQHEQVWNSTQHYVFAWYLICCVPYLFQTMFVSFKCDFVRIKQR